MEKQLEKQNALVCKQNNLVNASYKLNLGEQKLIIAISSMVNPLDKDFKEYFLSVNEFAELMNINLKKNTGLYSRLKRKSAILLSKRVTIPEPDGDLQTTWFASIKYFDNEAKIAFCFAPRLKKYYLHLSNQYTKYRIMNISNLNSQYSIRIYELLKQYEKLKTREFELNEFKIKICLNIEQYPRFYDLKKYVILVAQKELKEKTDISFEFEQIKAGRKVIGVRFYIHDNKHKNEIAADTKIKTIEPSKIQNQNTTDIDKIKIVKSIIKENIKDSEAQSILNAANGDIEKIKEKYNLINTFDVVRNIVGAMIEALNEDWKTVGKTKVSTFNDYKQRTYDYDDLERKLLGWDKKDN